MKYRAALNAAPIEQSLARRLHAALSNACSVLLSHAVIIVDKLVQWQSVLINPALQPKMTGGERLRVLLRRSNQSLARDESRYKKAS